MNSSEETTIIKESISLSFYFMPVLVKNYQKASTQIMVWKNHKEIPFFLNQTEFKDHISLVHSIKSDVRKLEWLASRFVILQSGWLNSLKQLKKDQFGKPFVQDADFHLSISHSGSFIAILKTEAPSGIDIQMPISGIHKLSSKFIHNEEYHIWETQNLTEQIHWIWGAKESMYKAYGKKNLAFKDNIRISRARQKKDLLHMEGKLSIHQDSQQYKIYGEKIENAFLVYAIKK